LDSRERMGLQTKHAAHMPSGGTCNALKMSHDIPKGGLMMCGQEVSA